MARFYPSNSVSSSGVSSDDVTITSLDVPESKTALTSDSNDEVVQGKLKEVSSATEAVGSIDSDNSRVQLTVPTRGLYSLTAKLFTSFSDMANLIGLVAGKIAQGESILGVNGTFKGLGNATQADVRSGKTFSTAEFSDVPGTMAEHTGGNFKPSTSDKVVIAKDRYLTGDVIVQGDPNLIAANIKKNVTIFGIKGTADGWVVEETDMYNNGANPFSFSVSDSSLISFETGHILTKRQFDKEVFLSSYKKNNLTKYTKINFDYTVTSNATTTQKLTFEVLLSPNLNFDPPFNYGKVSGSSPENERRTVSLKLPDITSGIQRDGYLRIYIYNGDTKINVSAAKIHRIWLSMD